MRKKLRTPGNTFLVNLAISGDYEDDEDDDENYDDDGGNYDDDKKEDIEVKEPRAIFSLSTWLYQVMMRMLAMMMMTSMIGFGKYQQNGQNRSARSGRDWKPEQRKTYCERTITAFISK